MDEFSAEFNGDASEIVVSIDPSAGTVARFQHGYGLSCIVEITRSR